MSLAICHYCACMIDTDDGSDFGATKDHHIICEQCNHERNHNHD